MAFGIYALVFPRGETYIGSTARDFDLRESEHFYNLRRGKHGNAYLQRLFDKHGFPEFRILEECDDSLEVTLREQYWMDQYQGSHLINCGPAIPNVMFGRKLPPRSDEHSQKISKALIGKNLSKEHRQRISESLRGRSRPQSFSESVRGRKRSLEIRKKMSESQQNRDPEYREKISLALKGRIITPEWRQKISESHKGRDTMSPEIREKVTQFNRGRPRSPEAREKISKGLQGHSTPQETREKISRSLKKYYSQKRGEI